MSDLVEVTAGRAIAVGTAHPRFQHLKVEDMESRSSASVQYVYCSGIEAWTGAEFRHTLSAISRILAPGGFVRVVAQDLDALVYGYLLEWKSDQPTAMTRAQRLNAWRKNETAQFVFNEEDLRAELENAGFVDIWRLPVGASSVEVFRDCEPPLSTGLVLEARNPVLTE
jgi:predicted SAM-dependent methyltransferase